MFEDFYTSVVVEPEIVDGSMRYVAEGRYSEFSTTIGIRVELQVSDGKIDLIHLRTLE